jgi:hypothetical protein
MFSPVVYEKLLPLRVSGRVSRTERNQRRSEVFVDARPRQQNSS